MAELAARTAFVGRTLPAPAGATTAPIAAADDELRTRVYWGLWIAVAATLLFAVGDALLTRDSLRLLYPIKGFYLLTIALGFRALQRARDDAAVTRIALIAVGIAFLVASASSTIGNDPLTIPVLCCAVTLATAALIPWSVHAQCVAVALAAVAVLATTLTTDGVAPRLYAYPTIVLTFCLTLSIYLSRRFAAYRAIAAGAERRLRDEAQASSALARVGQALIAELDTGELLDRLAQLTVEVFGCNASYTWLRDADGTFHAVAGITDLPEEDQALRALALPEAAVAALLAQLRREGPVIFDDSALQGMATARMSRHHRVSHVVYLPIRKGDEIVGVQSVTFRERTTPLPATLLPIAAGVAQLASLALETTRLVEALNVADRLKTDFLANLSHELRTPLNVIIGYNDMLLDGAAGHLAGEQAALLGRAQHNARELLALMGAALELSRHEGRRLPLSLEPVVLGDLIDALAQEVAALSPLPGVDFAWSVDADLPPLTTDPLKLRMVLKNLIDNARKFTVRGRIAVAVAARDDGVQFAVSDTGPGIGAEDLLYVFEPFRQIAGGDTPGGVGLGLFLVRRLVEAMGGRVQAESRLGQGTTFRVWLPAHPPAR